MNWTNKSDGRAMVSANLPVGTSGTIRVFSGQLLFEALALIFWVVADDGYI